MIVFPFYRNLFPGAPPPHVDSLGSPFHEVMHGPPSSLTGLPPRKIKSSMISTPPRWSTVIHKSYHFHFRPDVKLLTSPPSPLSRSFFRRTDGTPQCPKTYFAGCRFPDPPAHPPFRCAAFNLDQIPETPVFSLSSYPSSLRFLLRRNFQA